MKASNNKSLVKAGKSKAKLGRVCLVVKIWGVKYKIFHGSFVDVPLVGPLMISDKVTWYRGCVVSIKMKSMTILVRYRRRWRCSGVDRVDIEFAERWFRLEDIKGVRDGPFPY